MKTIVIDGLTFTLNPINVEQAEEIFSGSLKPSEMNRKLVEYSTNRADGTALSPSDIAKMEWRCFQKLLAATLEVNGLVGETKGAPAQDASAPLVVSTPAS